MKQLIKWVAVLLIVALGTCCMAGSPKVPKSTETAAERLQATTVALVMTQETEEGLHVAPSCAGVWVSRVEFMTAAHCVEPELDMVAKLLGLYEIEVDAVGTVHEFILHEDTKDAEDTRNLVLQADDIRQAEVTVWDKGNDLALLRVKNEDMPPPHPIADIWRGRIFVGDDIHTVGHTVGFWWTYTRGWIAGDKHLTGPHEKPVHVLQVSTPIWSGNSGGGLYNSQGQLIGIASFVGIKGPSLGFFIHRNVVLTFLINNGVVDR